jgi:hypothetical protein
MAIVIPAYHLNEDEIKQAVADWVIARAEAKITEVELDRGAGGSVLAIVKLAGNPKPPTPATPGGVKPGSIEDQMTTNFPDDEPGPD